MLPPYLLLSATQSCVLQYPGHFSEPFHQLTGKMAESCTPAFSHGGIHGVSSSNVCAARGVGPFPRGSSEQVGWPTGPSEICCQHWALSFHTVSKTSVGCDSCVVALRLLFAGDHLVGRTRGSVADLLWGEVVKARGSESLSEWEGYDFAHTCWEETWLWNTSLNQSLAPYTCIIFFCATAGDTCLWIACETSHGGMAYKVEVVSGFSV